MRSTAHCTKPLLVALLTTAALSLTATGTSLGAAAAPRASAATTCSLKGHERSLGPTYVTSLSVSGGASCLTGLKLVHSFYRCRLGHGGVKGTCGGVEGFHCSEDRFQKITIQYSSRVTCTRGREAVRHVYTQFT